MRHAKAYCIPVLHLSPSIGSQFTLLRTKIAKNH